MKYARSKKRHSWKDVNKINECSLSYLCLQNVATLMPSPSHFHIESKEFYRLGLALGIPYRTCICLNQYVLKATRSRTLPGARV